MSETYIGVQRKNENAWQRFITKLLMRRGLVSSQLKSNIYSFILKWITRTGNFSEIYGLFNRFEVIVKDCWMSRSLRWSDWSEHVTENVQREGRVLSNNLMMKDLWTPPFLSRKMIWTSLLKLQVEKHFQTRKTAWFDGLNHWMPSNDWLIDWMIYWRIVKMTDLGTSDDNGRRNDRGLTAKINDLEAKLQHISSTMDQRMANLENLCNNSCQKA